MNTSLCREEARLRAAGRTLTASDLLQSKKGVTWEDPRTHHTDCLRQQDQLFTSTRYGNNGVAKTNHTVDSAGPSVQPSPTKELHPACGGQIVRLVGLCKGQCSQCGCAARGMLY